MEEELISKKELLQKYGISYGALYRWKRMGLIPEAWFIRKATPTGQETFFRRDQVCSRVELILERKEGVSLDDLAGELKEKQQEKKTIRQLIVSTRYQTVRYSIRELKALKIQDGDQEMDLLDYIKEVTL